MYINFLSILTLILKKEYILEERSFYGFCRSGNRDICLPFNDELFIVWKFSESIWAWYGDKYCLS